MREYEMPIEEQVKLLVKEFKGLKGSMDERFDSIDKKLGSLDGKVVSLDGKVETIDGKVDKLKVLLEETHAIAKLGLEGLEGLRESTDERFAAAAKANAEQTDLLKSLVVHVRKHVDRVEPPKRRRRRT